MLEAALIGNGIGAEMPWLRAIGSRIPFKPLKEAFNSSAYILGYGTKAVENARKGGHDSNLMATIMAEAEKGEAHVDDMDVKTESTSLIFAGSGTTANTMTFLSWAVVSRPQLRASLEEEVAKLGDSFTDADLEQLPLLNAVINETLRLYCAVPGSLPRVVPEGGATLDGYFVPPGTTVSTQAYTIHRDENLWPNAHVYVLSSSALAPDSLIHILVSIPPAGSKENTRVPQPKVHSVLLELVPTAVSASILLGWS